MNARLRPIFLIVLAALLFTNPGTGRAAPAPAREPALVINRVAGGTYFDPAKVNPLFVLVIGSDVRNGDPRPGRSDSLHIVAIDTKTGAGTIVGIPRDSWVPIVGAGTEKINASLVLGGPERTVATVTRLTGIRFHYWVLTEFSHFQRLVDSLGGVDVVVPYAMQDLKYSGANFPAGPRHMNGYNALAFARNRHATPDGDFSRSENQGRILLAGLKKFRADAANPLKLAKYLTVFRSQVVSNAPPRDLLALTLIAGRINPAKVRNIVLPGTAGSAGGASVVFLAPQVNDIFRKIRTNAVL